MWAAAGSVAALAAAPYLLSHPLGLKAALGLVNAAVPASIQVQTLSAGWGSQLFITGLQVAEACDEAEAAAGTPAAMPAGRLLLSVGQLETQQTLWQLLVAAYTRGSSSTAAGAVQVVLKRLAVDCSLHDDGQLRLARLLRRAHLMSPSSPAVQEDRHARLRSRNGTVSSDRRQRDTGGGKAAQWPPASYLHPQRPLALAGSLVLAGGAVQIQLSESTLHVPLEVG